jgi:hypothetical protein
MLSKTTKNNYDEVQMDHLRHNLAMTFEEKMIVLEEMNDLADFFKKSKVNGNSTIKMDQ